MNQTLPPYVKRKVNSPVNKKMMLLLVAFFVLLATILYFQSPISRVQTLEVSGTNLLTEQEVLEASQLSYNTSVLQLNPQKVKQRVESLTEVASAEVDFQFPNHVQVAIHEWPHVANIKTSQGPLAVLANGEVLYDRPWTEKYHDKPLFKPENEQDVLYLPQIADELSQMTPHLLDLIESIVVHSEGSDLEEVELFMQEGYQVYSPIKDMSQYMNYYPQIAHYLQAKEKKEGIVYMSKMPWYSPGKKEGNEENDAVEQTEALQTSP